VKLQEVQTVKTRTHEIHNREEFWELTDATKMGEKFRIDGNLKSLQHMPLEMLKNVLIQYRFFTHYYIADMAILISKLPFGTLRTILADILNEELGEGNAADSHPALYDDFLLSIGVTQEALDMPDPVCIRNLHDIQRSLIEQSWSYGVGLRGMGGECLCQIYLSTVHEYFSKNPEIIAMQDKIAWKFWDIHTGEVDLHHQTIVRAAIDDLLIAEPEHTNDLVDGYVESRTAWDRFWQQIFEAARRENVAGAAFANSYVPLAV
jgi:hypothetical protein